MVSLKEQILAKRRQFGHYENLPRHQDAFNSGYIQAMDEVLVLLEKQTTQQIREIFHQWIRAYPLTSSQVDVEVCVLLPKIQRDVLAVLVGDDEK